MSHSLRAFMDDLTRALSADAESDAERLRTVERVTAQLRLFVSACAEHPTATHSG